MMFIKKSPKSHGFVNLRQLEEIWSDQIDWVSREYDYAVFPIAIHPDVAGRPQVLLMLERTIAHINAQPAARWVTFAEAADDFRHRHPRQGQARPESIRESWTLGPVATKQCGGHRDD
jgi:hypothetical protein